MQALAVLGVLALVQWAALDGTFSSLLLAIILAIGLIYFKHLFLFFQSLF